ncbi:MAG TPA: phosphoadenosine phosphosulfate reductase family protein, partial [Chitinophagaceae bacterium]|nr:phosphoadenosine phosphosulfate reductase family protein [Chitinophagaceae bacterium]
MQPIQKFLDGQVLLFYKPLKWTSFDVVKKIRSLIKVSKIGHAGTLDPLATGLLIICTGKFTKKINEFMGQPKTYTGSFTLGATTSSYDLEQTPENFKDISHLTATEIYNATLPFIGNILQMPPQHSAIKKDGKGRDFDCIMGMSGGADSSYMLHLVVKEFGLRPLVFHVDGGWNSELAVNNIEVLIDKLGLDLYTEVIDWEEMKDLQLAFFKAGVPHIDIPQDHAFVATLYNFAEKYDIKY